MIKIQIVKHRNYQLYYNNQTLLTNIHPSNQSCIRWVHRYGYERNLHKQESLPTISFFIDFFYESDNLIRLLDMDL